MTITTEKLSDSDIEVAKRDRKKFHKIYLYFIKEIFSFAYYLSANKDKAEDICSDTFLKALANINKFEGDVKSFRAWIYRICRNSAYESFNKTKREIYDEDIINNAVDNTDYDLEILTKDVFKKIFMLEKNYREVLLLRFKNDFSYEEISQITNLTQANVRQIISRGLSKLKKLINSNEN